MSTNPIETSHLNPIPDSLRDKPEAAKLYLEINPEINDIFKTIPLDQRGTSWQRIIRKDYIMGLLVKDLKQPNEALASFVEKNLSEHKKQMQVEEPQSYSEQWLEMQEEYTSRVYQNYLRNKRRGKLAVHSF